MHMTDALIAPTVAGAMYICSAGAARYSMKKLSLENDPKKIPLMGIMGAFIFAAQMINFTIPGTGSSGHLCGGMLLSAVLGPYAGFLTMIGVLFIQCLLFADGGILAFGANVWNMAFYGCFIGAMIIWKYTMAKGITKKKIIFASVLGSILTLQLGAFSVTLQTLASNITELPFAVFVSTMQPIHLAIGLVEGLITASVLCFVYEARPELLWKGKDISLEKEGKVSYKNTIIILAVAASVIGGLLSLMASSHPDGLEWSIEKIAGSTELASSGIAYEVAEKIQGITALFPDYSFKGSESILGTSFSGIFGGIAVIVLCIVSCYLFNFFKGKSENE